MRYVMAIRTLLYCTPFVLVLLILASGNVSAQQLDNPGPYGFWSQDTLTGDWGGLRSKLKEDGVDIHAYYMGFIGDDIHGGLKEGHSYADQTNLQVDFDLAKLFDWDGATFRINVNDRKGTAFSVRHVGSKLEQNWAYGAGEIARLQWAALSQNLFDKKLNLIIGWFSLGSEFGFATIQAPFLDNGINGHPQILPTDASGGWDDYPIAGWGTRAKYYFAPDLYFKIGLFEVNPDLNSGNYGFQRNISHATGIIIPAELTKETAFGGDAKTGLIGHYTVGGYFESGHVPEILHPTEKTDGRNAEYLMVDQMIYRSSSQPKQWLSLFTQWVTADRTVLPLSSYVDIGAIFHGPFASRPNDSINLGWVKENINPNSLLVEAVATHKPLSAFGPNEQDWELDYVLQVTPWLQLTPALQYVTDPGAYSFKRYSNAEVLSLQVQVVF